MSEFEWHRMHKHEEQIENDVYDRVQTQILEHYDVEDISTLTQKQWDDIMEWREEPVSESRLMYGGFADVYNVWENEQEDSI
jgi:hypothetical protein